MFCVMNLKNIKKFWFCDYDELNINFQAKVALSVYKGYP